MKVIKNCLYMYKMIWEVSKLRILLISVLVISDAVNMLVMTFFFKFAIDALISEDFNFFLVVVAIRVGVLLVNQTIGNFFHTVIFPVMDNKIKLSINLKMYEKVKKIDLYSAEQAEFYEIYNKAINESDNRAIEMLNSLQGIIGVILQAGLLFSVLAFLSPITILIAIIGCLPTFWGNFVNTKKVFNYENNKRNVQRILDYIRRVYYLPQYAKDIRTTNISKILNTKYTYETENLNNVVKKESKSIALVCIVGSWLFNAINIGISSIFIGYRIIQKTMTVGDFVTSINAIVNLSVSLTMFLNIIPEYKQHSLFIDNYLKVMNYESTIYKKINNKPIPNTKSEIELKNVCFSYPNRDNILKNINIRISANEKIAFVGENGAGKSTILKLIMRLYDPSSGEFLLNNVPYKDIDVKEINNNITAVFQDFQCYAFNLKDNILFNTENFDEKKLASILEQTGLNSLCDKLNQGYNTNITTELQSEGVNLSGGQYQKIAIARALYDDKKIIIMDEPTSALDPLAEQELFDMIETTTKDKTLIVVSHRLSLVKNMDRIYYIKNGEITEVGTHTELMSLNNEYAKMFNLQAERYGV